MSNVKKEQRNKQLIRDLIADVDRGDPGAIDRFYAPDYKDNNPSPGRSLAEGIEGIRLAFQAFQEAFPDTRHEIHDLIAEGDRVVARISAWATHTGTILGIPATGKEVTLEAIAIYRIEDDKIAERWAFQGKGILEQLQQGRRNSPALPRTDP